MEPGISTTTLAILRGTGQDDDPYEASTANIELLDDEDALDEALDAAILMGEFDQPLLEDDNNEEQEGEPSQILPLRPK
ncbi:hypothetical protein N431DRAFT_461384 [Stipitochalara longipes BDJ]|nr:hypothetical protein N431DRAFT_461384 [Stipitochalara longipes BDJ]